MKEQYETVIMTLRDDVEKKLLEEVKKIEAAEKKLVNENNTLEKKLSVAVSDFDKNTLASEKRIMNEAANGFVSAKTRNKDIEKRLAESEARHIETARKLLENESSNNNIDKRIL